MSGRPEQAMGLDWTSARAQLFDELRHWVYEPSRRPQKPGGRPSVDQAARDPTTPYWLVYTKLSQMHGGLGPSDIWVLIDQHPDSMSFPDFANVMTEGTTGRPAFDSVPAKSHNNGCGISFADGHSEIHRWQYPGLIPDPVYANVGFSYNTAPTDQDVCWFYYHTTIPVSSY